MAKKKRKVQKRRVVKKQVKKRSTIQNKSFWLVMGVVFAMSIAAVFIASNGFPLTGNAIQPLSFVKGGTSMMMEFKGIQSMKNAEVFFGETIKGSNIAFNEDQTISFDGVAYAKIKGESPDADKISSINFNLKIEKNKLLGLGISKEELHLYNNGKELQTTLSHEAGEFLYYTATSNGLGDFVVGKMEGKVMMPEVEEEKVMAKEEIKEIEEPVTQKPAEVKKEVVVKEEEEEGAFSKFVSFFKNIFN